MDSQIPPRRGLHQSPQDARQHLLQNQRPSERGQFAESCRLHGLSFGTHHVDFHDFRYVLSGIFVVARKSRGVGSRGGGEGSAGPKAFDHAFDCLTKSYIFQGNLPVGDERQVTLIGPTYCMSKSPSFARYEPPCTFWI